MFTKQTLISVIILACLALGVGVQLSLFTGPAPACNPEQALQRTASLPFQQTRTQVRRDLYGEHQDKPIHAIVCSQEAELVYDMFSGELVEHMSEVSGEIHESDALDTFSADVAAYNHKTHHLIASDIRGFRHEVGSPAWEGTADYAQGWLAPEGIRLEAVHLHVTDGKKNPLTVDSRSAFYSGSVLQLEGQVALGLSMGRLLADRALLNPHTSQGDFSGHLSVQMSSGGLLEADHCHVDRRQSNAVFTAANKVVYREPHFEAHKPLELTCDKLTIQSAKASAVASEIIAEGDVEAVYDNVWELSADRATYYSGAERSLVLEGNKQGGCLIASPYGDYLVAQRIESALSDNQVTFYQLTGELHDGITTLQTDQAIWDQRNGFLTCYDHTCVENKDHGTLTADGELQAAFNQDAGLELATAYHQGFLEFHTTDDKHLSCAGECLLDHQKKYLTLTAEEPDTPVRLSDTLGQLDADTLSLWYDWAEKTFTAKKLVAEGHVSLQRPEEGALQVALADRMEYLPEQDKINLTARPANRVLYYDPHRKMTASAREVDITRDTDTNKVSLRGKGDVQFTLMEAELQAMRKYLEGMQHGKK